MEMTLNNGFCEMTQDEIKAIGEGRVWLGTKGVEIGIVDVTGKEQPLLWPHSPSTVGHYIPDFGTNTTG